MSWFDLTSSRLQQLGLWTSFLQLPLFSSWNVPSQPETFGRSDAEKYRKMLRWLRRRLRFSVIIVRVDFSLFFPLFFGMFWCFGNEQPDVLRLHSFFISSDVGGTCVLLGPLGRGAAGLGSKYPRSLVYLKFGVENTGNLVEWCWMVRVWR